MLQNFECRCKDGYEGDGSSCAKTLGTLLFNLIGYLQIINKEEYSVKQKDNTFCRRCLLLGVYRRILWHSWWHKTYQKAMWCWKLCMPNVYNRYESRNTLVNGRHRIWHVSKQVQLSMPIKFRIILFTLIFRTEQRQKSIVSPDVFPCWSTNTNGMHWSVDGFATSPSPRRY